MAKVAPLLGTAPDAGPRITNTHINLHSCTQGGSNMLFIDDELFWYSDNDGKMDLTQCLQQSNTGQSVEFSTDGAKWSGRNANGIECASGGRREYDWCYRGETFRSLRLLTGT